MNPILKYKKFTLFFLVVMIFNYLGLTVIPEFYKVSKAMIMGSLIGFYIFEIRNQNEFFILGMIAALLGDCFLLFESDAFFLLGMGSFLFMQLFYTVRFLKDRDKTEKPKMVFPLVLISISLAFLLITWDAIGDMAVYITIYALAITLMAIIAYLRKTSLIGFQYVVLGAVLFVASDLSLALNKFYMDLPYSSYIVMTTYMLAQYFIVSGIVLQKEKIDKESEPKSKLSNSALSKI